MAGQDPLHACLSIDPITGALESIGLCEEETKLRLHLDYNEKGNSGNFRGKAIVVGKEAGGLEGARKRAARFKEMIDERVARNEEERALLAWVYEDPMYGKSLEEWLWTGRLVVNQEKGKMGGDVSDALEMHWAGGEGGKGGGVEGAGGEVGKAGGGGGGGGGGVEITPIADVLDFGNQHGIWMRSLAFLNSILGAVWIEEADRLMRESKVNFRAGEKQDPLIMSRFDIGLDRRLSNLAYKLTLEHKLVWVGHEWVDGDTFSVTLLDGTPALGKEAQVSCPICDEVCLTGFLILRPCNHITCELCWRRHWVASKERKPMEDVRCPFCLLPASRSTSRLNQSRNSG